MIQFGTGGWREIIGDKFTRENIHRVAHALSSMKEVKKVVKEAENTLNKGEE